MADEYIQAETIDDYWRQLKSIYVRRSEEWKDLTKEDYETIERSEREDSDNHLNQERLGKDTNVIDACRYKYMPERKVAYHISLIHRDGSSQDKYFQITLKENLA